MFHMTMFPKPLKNLNEGFSVQTESCKEIPPDWKNNKDSCFDSPNRQDKESYTRTEKTKNLSEELLKRILSNHVLDSGLKAKLTDLLLNKKDDSKDTNKEILKTVMTTVEPKAGIFNLRESASFDKSKTYVNKINQPLYDEAVVSPMNMLIGTRKEKSNLLYSNKSGDQKRRINDKSTYCRPLLSSNNEEYVLSTEDKNNQLKKIVRRMLQIRDEGNQKELWNNYINSLRLKHGYSVIADKDSTQIEINHNFNEESRLEMQKTYKDLIKDLYEAVQGYEYSSNDDIENGNVDFDKLCFPSSSHVLGMLNKNNKYSKNGGLSIKIIPKYKTKSIQTGEETQSPVDTMEETYINKLMTFSSCFLRKKLNVLVSDNKVNQTTLRSIETKVDDLVETINEFINEVKTNRRCDQNNMCRIEGTTDNKDKQDDNTSEDDRDRTKCLCNMILDAKAIKQKVNKLKHSNVTYGNTTTASYLTVESKLLSDKQQQKKKYQPDNGKSMTIAVNTDPLGLLALLAVSTEALKKIFSYMPNFSVATQYWSLEQLRAGSEGIMSYICNICGASFSKPSELSNHITLHNLANDRNCCICRQLLERGLHQFKRFRCQYCGEGFTRAYCCYLHEDSCARSLGKPPDTPTNLRILR